MIIRQFQRGDEAALRALFHASVHGLASQHYTRAQLQAWAPGHYDGARWAQRMAANRPYIAMVGADFAGFADVQPSGYIDHFFVSPAYARQGVGTALMTQLLRTASERGTGLLSSNVSLAAQPLFQKFGFVVVTKNQVVINDVALENATMQLAL